MPPLKASAPVEWRVFVGRGAASGATAGWVIEETLWYDRLTLKVLMGSIRWRQVFDTFTAAARRRDNKTDSKISATETLSTVSVASPSSGAHVAVALAPAKLTIGQELGYYQIVSTLGAGGMGEVYRAHDRNLGRDIAIKTLRITKAHRSEAVARLRREARMLASLNHPHIASIYGLE